MPQQTIIYLHDNNTRPIRINIEDIVNHLNDNIYVYPDGEHRPRFIEVEELLTLEGDYKLYYHCSETCRRPIKDDRGVLTVNILPSFDNSTKLIMVLFNSLQTEDPPKFVSFLNYSLNQDNEISSITENKSFFTPALPYQGGVAISPQKTNAIACYSWHSTDSEAAKGSPTIDLFDSNLDRIDQFTFPDENIQCMNLQYSNSGRYVGVGTLDNTGNDPLNFHVFDVSKNKIEMVTSIDSGGAGRKCGFTSDDAYVAIAHNAAGIWDNGSFLGFEGPGLSVCKFENRELEIVSQYNYNDNAGNCAEFNPSDDLLAVTFFNGDKVFLFSHNNGNIQLLDEYESEDYPWEVTWHPSGEYIAVTQRGTPQLRILSVENNQLSEVDNKTLNGRSMSSRFTKNGENLVVTSRSDGENVFAYSFDEETGQLSATETASYSGPEGSKHTTSIDII